MSDTSTPEATLKLGFSENMVAEISVEPTVEATAADGGSAMETDAADTTETEPMEVDEQTPNMTLTQTSAMSTPVKSTRNASNELGDIITGATPKQRGEPQFKSVYPPSEDAQSLIVEHFGFLPISFIDEIINAANDTIYRATDALCKFVEKEQGSSEATNQAINKAETLLEHAVDKNFDKFELYALRNLFNVPQGLDSYIVMPHHSADVTGGSVVYAEDEADLDKELADVRNQITANKLLKTRLLNDVRKVERGVRRLRALNENLHMGEISQRMLKGNAQGAVEGARAQIAEVEQLVQQLEDVVGSELVPSSMDVLKEPSGRDLYLAHMSDIQTLAWESRQAQPQVN